MWREFNIINQTIYFLYLSSDLAWLFQGFDFIRSSCVRNINNLVIWAHLDDKLQKRALYRRRRLICEFQLYRSWNSKVNAAEAHGTNSSGAKSQKMRQTRFRLLHQVANVSWFYLFDRDIYWYHSLSVHTTILLGQKYKDHWSIAAWHFSVYEFLCNDKQTWAFGIILE